MSKKDDPADTDDKALFLKAMQDVAPLIVSEKAILKPKKPTPKPRQKNPFHSSDTLDTADTHMLEIDAGDEWSFSRPGVSHQTLRRLKRGYWQIRDRLDLHGLTQDEAKHHLGIFLNNALQMQFRCVLIIHGKGLSSGNRKPVLKNSIGNWLAGHSSVLAFCQAKPEYGGGGAVMVLLKAKERTKSA